MTKVIHLHRITPEDLDNGKRIVPYNTGRVCVGLSYVPKQKPTDAECIEHYRAPGYGMFWWVVFSAVSFAGLVLVVVTR